MGYVREDSYSDNYNIQFACGGTIISEFYIMTAAHCASTERPPVLVRLGKVSKAEAIFFVNLALIEIFALPSQILNVDKNDTTRTENRRIFVSIISKTN